MKREFDAKSANWKSFHTYRPKPYQSVLIWSSDYSYPVVARFDPEKGNGKGAWVVETYDQDIVIPSVHGDFEDQTIQYWMALPEPPPNYR